MICTFGKYDYKKATLDEIAKAAGISKSLLFHYFNNKKELYIFVYKYSIEVMKNKLNEAQLDNETDFFELMKKTILKKAEILAVYPLLTEFLLHAYYETYTDVADDIATINSELMTDIYPTYLKNIKTNKFKDNISLEMAMNIVTWISDGYMNSKKNTYIKVNEIVDEFSKYLDLLKNLLYKEA